MSPTVEDALINKAEILDRIAQQVANTEFSSNFHNIAEEFMRWAMLVVLSTTEFGDQEPITRQVFQSNEK